MLKLSSEITIKGDQTWQFNALANCSIVEDIATLTDTCELQLPKKILWQNAVLQNGKPPIKRGDQITVSLGYNDTLFTRFTGFVRSVDAKVPITIKCEDGMFLLKTKKAEPKSFKNALVSEVLKHLLKDTNIEFQLIDENLKVGSWRISKPTVAEELQELKEKQLLTAYFRTINNKSILYVGLLYPTDNRKKHIFKHSKNIINEDFEYRDENDIKARVEAVSFNAKHQKNTIEIGDKEGDLIKIRIDGVEPEDLKKYAQQALKEFMKKLPFNGELVLAHLIDELQKIEGVEIPHLVQAQTSWIDAGTGNYGQMQNIDVRQLPVSGYFKITTFDNIEYVV